MDNIVLLIAVFAAGAYFADEVRDKVPALDRNKE